MSLVAVMGCCEKEGVRERMAERRVIWTMCRDRVKDNMI